MSLRRPFPSKNWPAALRASRDTGYAGFQVCQVCGTKPGDSADGMGRGAKRQFLVKSEDFKDLYPTGDDVDVQARPFRYVCTSASCCQAGRWRVAWEEREDRLEQARAAEAVPMCGFAVGSDAAAGTVTLQLPAKAGGRAVVLPLRTHPVLAKALLRHFAEAAPAMMFELVQEVMASADGGQA